MKTLKKKKRYELSRYLFPRLLDDTKNSISKIFI